jgi:hypothetical protein
MLGWGALIAVLLFLAMLPGFLGLFVVLPVLGHASWHLYRRALDLGRRVRKRAPCVCRAPLSGAALRACNQKGPGGDPGPSGDCAEPALRGLAVARQGRRWLLRAPRAARPEASGSS